jgi:hemoglobin
MQINSENFYEVLGGRLTLDKVHKIFYDKIYAHPWISNYFNGIDQAIIESQQSDFMAQAMGGPSMYCGKLIIPAHKHMFISEELFELRTQLLIESMNEAGVSAAHQEKWLKIDQSFKKGIIKKDQTECSTRFNSDNIVYFPDPYKKQVV